MKNVMIRILIFLKQRIHSFYEFLERHGFFDEMVRGAVKLIFFIVILYCFKQVVW